MSIDLVVIEKSPGEYLCAEEAKVKQPVGKKWTVGGFFKDMGLVIIFLLQANCNMNWEIVHRNKSNESIA